MATALYKNYKIVTENRGKSTDYEVYAPLVYGGRCETAGFLMNDVHGDDETFAEYHCRDLIDAGMETPMLKALRVMPKY